MKAPQPPFDYTNYARERALLADTGEAEVERMERRRAVVLSDKLGVGSDDQCVIIQTKLGDRFAEAWLSEREPAP